LYLIYSIGKLKSLKEFTYKDPHKERLWSTPTKFPSLDRLMCQIWQLCSKRCAHELWGYKFLAAWGPVTLGLLVQSVYCVKFCCSEAKYRQAIFVGRHHRPTKNCTRKFGRLFDF